MTIVGVDAADRDGDDTTQGHAAWTTDAREWLATHCAERNPRAERSTLALFHNQTDDEERIMLAAAMEWQRQKFEAGYAAITVDPELGGRGLSADHARAFEQLEPIPFD